jgi:spore maturation protein CgeB
LRRTFLEPVENALGMPLDAEFTQEEYLTVLRQSRICLCLFGLGFDTVRYWEAAAQGAMLLANRPPIHIPHNFVDGQSAVFFDDLPDLLAKLGYYLAHPAESLAIADAGHALLCEHHTTRARASQLLAWMNNA